MLEKQKNTFRKCKYVGSQVIYTINHDLLISKLEDKEFAQSVPLYMRSYYKNRSQAVNVNSAFSIFEEIVAVALEGSMLGPL